MNWNTRVSKTDATEQFMVTDKILEFGPKWPLPELSHLWALSLNVCIYVLDNLLFIINTKHSSILLNSFH